VAALGVFQQSRAQAYIIRVAAVRVLALALVALAVVETAVMYR
jgi:hypothetical protein